MAHDAVALVGNGDGIDRTCDAGGNGKLCCSIGNLLPSAIIVVTQPLAVQTDVVLM